MKKAETQEQEFLEVCSSYDHDLLNITVRQSRQSGVARATCPD